MKKPKQIALPPHIEEHLKRLQIKAQVIVQDNGKTMYVLSTMNYIKTFASEAHLVLHCKTLFAQFFCEFMLVRQDIGISQIDKINWFISELNLELAVSNNELTLEALIKNWYRYRNRLKKPKTDSKAA